MLFNRILFVTGRLSGGGAERVMSILSNEFALRDKVVCICCMAEKEESLKSFSITSGVRCVYLGGKSFSKFGLLKRQFGLRKLVKGFKPDIIIPFMVYNAIQVIMSTVAIRVPIVVRITNTLESEISTRFLKRWARLLLKKITGVVYQHQEQKEEFTEHISKPNTIIHNPIETNPLWIKEKDYSQKRIISVGRIENQKNYPLLLKSFAKIVTDYPDWTLEICGEGLLETEIKNEAARLHLHNKVRFSGYVVDVFERMHNASVFILSSSYEGMPNALIEAMCMGCACITTDSSGAVRTLIEDGINGIIVPSEGLESLSNAMCRLLSDDKIRKQIGQEATKLRDKFNVSIVTDEWEDFINTLI